MTHLFFRIPQQRSMLFLCWGITNPPVLIGRTFFYGGLQIRRDAWRVYAFGDHLGVFARRLSRSESARRLSRSESARCLSRSESARCLSRSESARCLSRSESARRLSRSESARRLSRSESARRLSRSESARRLSEASPLGVPPDLQSGVKRCPNLLMLCGFAIRSKGVCINLDKKKSAFTA